MAMGTPDAAVEAALASIYASLPRVECRRLCHGSCGPIVMSALEWQRLTSTHGARTCGDELVCPYLDVSGGLCRAYALRPLICRIGGTSRSLRCVFGCRPERELTDLEVESLIERVQALSGGLARSVWPGWQRYLEAAGRSPTDGGRNLAAGSAVIARWARPPAHGEPSLP